MKANRQRIICLGDSLTEAIPDPVLDKWVTQLALHLEKKWPETYDVYNRGYNGATTHDLMNKIEGEMGYLLPAIVLVAIGVNDSLIRAFRKTPQVGVEDFKTNLGDIDQFVRAKGGKSVFIVEHVPNEDGRREGTRMIAGNGKLYRENYAPYCQAVVDAGKKFNVPVIDLPAQMKSKGVTTADIVMDDGLHLTSAGHAILGQIIFEQLCPMLPDLLTPEAPGKHYT